MKQDKEDRDKRLRLLMLGAAASAGVGTGLFIYASAVEPSIIEVEEIELTLPRLDPEFDGYKVVQISDIHAGPWMPRRRLERMVNIANEHAPDLVAITGDFITRVHLKAPHDVAPRLRQLRARDGVVSVRGNHDYWGGRRSRMVDRMIHESGIRDLDNKVYTLRRGGAMFHIAGVDSVREHMDRLDLVLKKLPAEGAVMLLAHEPDFADRSAATGRFDLQISGHSHGGQVVVPFVGPPRLPKLGRKYVEGLYYIGDMALYTNRGIGTIGVPFRFFARPEITFFTLRSPVGGEQGERQTELSTRG